MNISKYPNEIARRCIAVQTALVAALFLLGAAPASAQNTYPKYRCSDGEYTGPEPGKASYVKDPYTWFVTRNFAQRFCMPKEFIADDLKGAEAIAFRYKPSDHEVCRLVDGKEICNREYVLWMELYVSSSANLPKYDPEVGFYVRDVFTSGSIISNAQSLRNADRRRTLQWQDPLGKRAPYFGANRRDGKPRTSFILLGVQADETVRYKTYYYEDLYLENWVEGIDLIAIQRGAMANPAGVEAHRKDKREAIGILSGYLGNENQTEAAKRRLSDFLHVIEVPRRLSEMKLEIGIRAYEQRPKPPALPAR